MANSFKSISAPWACFMLAVILIPVSVHAEPLRMRCIPPVTDPTAREKNDVFDLDMNARTLTRIGGSGRIYKVDISDRYITFEINDRLFGPSYEIRIDRVTGAYESNLSNGRKTSSFTKDGTCDRVIMHDP